MNDLATQTNPGRWTAEPPHAASAEPYADIVEASPSGLLQVRADGTTALANRAIEAMFGYDRAELLGRLGLPFDIAAPNVDETPLVDEHPEALALRLSIAKAAACNSPQLCHLPLYSIAFAVASIAQTVSIWRARTALIFYPRAK